MLMQNNSLIHHPSALVAAARLTLDTSPLGSLLRTPQGTTGLFHLSNGAHPQHDHSCVRRLANQQIAYFSRRPDDTWIYLLTGTTPINRIQVYLAPRRTLALHSVTPCHPVDYALWPFFDLFDARLNTLPSTCRTLECFAGASSNYAPHALAHRRFSIMRAPIFGVLSTIPAGPHGVLPTSTPANPR